MRIIQSFAILFIALILLANFAVSIFVFVLVDCCRAVEFKI